MPSAENGFHDIDEKTERARRLLFKLENTLRCFIISRIGADKERIQESFLKGWKSSRRKEKTPPRKPLDYELIYYSTFENLKKIILQNENWSQLFQKNFGRQDGIISRLTELDSIRNTIAHNRLLSDFDYRSFIMLYEQIMSCLPEGENLIEDLILERTPSLVDRQKTGLLPDIIDITQLKVDNNLLDSLYQVSRRKAKDLYDDAKLSELAIQVYPYSPIGRNEAVYFKFYSKWADKISRFRCNFLDKYHSVGHLIPDRHPKSDANRVVFLDLPWKKSPKWRQFLRRLFIKIGPIPPASAVCYHFWATSNEKTPWNFVLNDIFNDETYYSKWDGKGLNEISYYTH